MTNCYIGADPGDKGGLVAFPDDCDRRPSIPSPPNHKWSKRYFYNLEKGDPDGALDWMRDIVSKFDNVFAVLEQIPRSIFRIRKSDMSLLYGSYRELRMVFVSSGVPFEEAPVTPPTKTWLREFVTARKKGESLAHWKKRHGDCARILYNDASISDQMSDAYLLAELCRRSRTGTLKEITL